MSDIPQALAAALSDRYVVERQVGAGGMATVYLARDLRHKRAVALKVVRPELGGREGVERFPVLWEGLQEITGERPGAR